MIYEEITEDIINEKLITYGNRKAYGQVVFVAGGAGSGKGFAISNFLDSSSFKIRDVDEMKKQLQILNRMGKLDINSIIKKHGKNIKQKDIDLINKIQAKGFKLQNLNLKNPDHVYALHILVDAMGVKDKTLEALLSGKSNPETLPNILFDITAKKVTSITSVVSDLKKAGYKADNIHLTWILTNYVTAMVNNRNRARMVPEDILLQTHEGASNTIWGLVTKALPKGMNGRIDVILNNPEHTVFHTDADGKTIKGKVKGFKSLPLKKAKGGIYPEKLWKKILFSWVKDNAPETITANMKESVVNEGYIDNYDLYVTQFKKRRFKKTADSSNYGDEFWYKEYPLGRFVVTIGESDAKRLRFSYSVYFNPFPKYKKVFFGLIKTKKKQLGKFINYKEDIIDFGEGLFKIDDTVFIKKLFKVVDAAEQQVKKITKVDYESYKDSENMHHTALESVITEKQFKGLDGIDTKTPLTKISDVQKLKIIQSTGNIISFFVPKGFDRNFWQVISKGKIKKGKDLSGGVVYILTGKMINSPKFKSIKDLIKGVDWASVEKSRRFNESTK